VQAAVNVASALSLACDHPKYYGSIPGFASNSWIPTAYALLQQDDEQVLLCLLPILERISLRPCPIKPTDEMEGIASALPRIIQQGYPTMSRRAMHVLRNLAMYPDRNRDAVKQWVVKDHFLSFFGSILRECADVFQQVDVLWLINSMVAGTPAHLQAVIDAGFIPILLDTIAHVSQQFNTRSVATCALSNMTYPHGFV
jgi:hypothetical protein